MTFDVSVIIPTFNRAELLLKTVDTIINQSHPVKEIIIIDDGSTDDTIQKVSQYHHKIKAVHINNSGQMVAFNKGVSIANGSYLAFCDSDDLWKPNYIEDIKRIWEIEPSTNAAFANFQIVRDNVWIEGSKFDDAPISFWNKFDIVEPNAYGFFRHSPIPNLVAFNPFFVSAMVVRADFFRAMGGWDEAWNRKMSQDFATTLRVAEHPPIGLALRPTVGIRKHAGNFSADVQKMLLGDAAILDHVLQTRPSLTLHADAIRQSILTRRADALEIAFAQQNFAAVSEIAALIGDTALPSRVRLKARIAQLPAPLRGVVVPLLLGLGTMRSRLR